MDSSKPPAADGGAVGEDKKPVRVLNRVPSESIPDFCLYPAGADNPPCKRCRNSGLDCLFEKPSREASLTGEAGLERIRSLEAHVADIRTTQNAIRENQLAMHSALGQLLTEIRASRYGSGYQRSPSLASPSLATPSNQPASGDLSAGPHQVPSFGPPPPGRRTSYSAHGVSAAPSSDFNSTTQGTGYSQSSQHFSPGHSLSTSHQTQLPPLASLPGMGGLSQSGSRIPFHHSTSYAGTKRSAGVSKVTSPNSSDLEDEDGGDLPARGLVAPLRVLQGLADVAVEREKNGDLPSEAPSRTTSPNPTERPTKRRRLVPPPLQGPSFSDVVAKNVITESEARDLFRIFYNGCSTFLPVFNINVDTFESLRERSPFAVNAICMAAARVRDGGGQPSETYTKILDEVQHISRYTLFSPVTRFEAVQSMLIIAGWSDNGWLTGGHAVRMAMELSLENSWPRLRRRIVTHKADATTDRDLVTGTRLWLCLYLYEHQISYGTGRPAILRDDDSVKDCRLFLQHPLAVEDDMRLISTVELMALREHITNLMGDVDAHHITDHHFQILREADKEFRSWFEKWDHAFSQKYEDAAFYRQSLQIQQIFGQLYHYATALTGIYGPDDIEGIPPQQRDIALRSIDLAMQGLDIIATSSTYRQGMKYAVNFTHATATFAASLLLRLARLFPDHCDMTKIRQEVESLANLMAEIPGKRYALTLHMMLKRGRKRDGSSREASSTSPPSTGPPHMIIQPHNPIMQIAEQLWRGFQDMSADQLPVWLSDMTMGGAQIARHGMDAFLLPQHMMPAPQIW
ncbi:hypothetical protein DL96DRAFT_1575298 [Flagelloscypha sp. PMI_526]|nr:hypothetical protein DL96DRAFT_1575298 [Flagelloscypha sp. PMI_526]